MNSKFGECCNCPALVDGRFFTNWRDRDDLQYNIMKQNNLSNSNQFRDYLITNAANIISSNIKDIEKNYKCNYNTPANQTVIGADNGGNLNGNDNSDVFASFSPATAPPAVARPAVAPPAVARPAVASPAAK